MATEPLSGNPENLIEVIGSYIFDIYYGCGVFIQDISGTSFYC